MMIFYVIFLGGMVVWRGIWVQKCHWWWKIIFSFFTLTVAGKFYVLRIFSGASSFFNPELPAWVLIPAAWLFAVVIFFFFWLVIYDSVSLICKFFCRIKKRKIPRFFSDPAWRLTGLVPAAVMVTIGIYGGLKIPQVAQYTVEFANLPPEIDGMRIVHLSDLHIDPLTRKDKLQTIVDLANAQHGDLIVITGDFVDGKIEVRARDLELLADLHAPLGVYGSPGNHEYYSGYDQWMNFFNSHGVQMLENISVMPNKYFALGGVTDPAYRQKGGAGPDVKKTFAGVGEKTFKILLAHQPKLAVQAAENGVDLQLSGHTHGGMFWGLDLLVAFFNNGWISGSYDVGKMKLHVSNGTGIWNGFPIRIGHPSEIVVLTLKKK